MAYHQLKNAILDNELAAGQRYSVVSLASKMGMSRSPIRSAVERLEAEELMVIANDGVAVPQLGIADLLDALAVRAPLEGVVARLLAPRLEQADAAELERLHFRFEHAVEKGDRKLARNLDLDFHEAIRARCGNPYLAGCLERVQARVVVASYTSAWTPHHQQAVPEHAQILAGLQARDGEAACRAAVVHMDNLAQRVRSIREQ